MTGGDNKHSSYLNVYIITLFRIIGSLHTHSLNTIFNEIIGRKDLAQYNLRSKTLTKINFRFCSVKQKIEKDETSKYA